MAAEGLLTDSSFDECVRAVAGAKNRRLDLERFGEFILLLDDVAGKAEATAAAAAVAAADDDDDDATAGVNDDDDDEDEDDFVPLTDEEFQEVALAMYQDLSVAAGRADRLVPVPALRALEDVSDMISEGLLDEGALMAFVALSGSDGDVLTAAQFVDVFRALDEATMDDDDDDDSFMDGLEGFEGEDITGEDAAVVAEELTRELFDELRGTQVATGTGTGTANGGAGADTVSVATFLGWSGLRELLEEGSIDMHTLHTFIQNVGASASLKGPGSQLSLHQVASTTMPST